MSEADPVTELELARSVVTGKLSRLCVDRRHLRRALQLGCTELLLPNPENALLARSESRRYVFLPLAGAKALLASADAQRIFSALGDVEKSSTSPSRRSLMPRPPPNGNATNGAHPASSPADRLPTVPDLITEAAELRNLLQDATTRLARLLAGLKQHRRQSKAMQDAMKSLRQLQLDG